MDNMIITISREYGSGGRLIGQKVAEKLDIAFYDRNLIDMVAKETGFDQKYIANWEERAPSPHLWGSAIGANSPMQAALQIEPFYINDQLMYEAQSEIIFSIAKKSSCVIVGRCANHLLQDNPGCFNVFIHADFAARVRRAVDDYGVAQEHAEKGVKKMDKDREAYVEDNTGRRMDDCHNYHLTVDSGLLGLELCVDTIVQTAGAFKSNMDAK